MIDITMKLNKTYILFRIFSYDKFREGTTCKPCILQSICGEKLTEMMGSTLRLAQTSFSRVSFFKADLNSDRLKVRFEQVVLPESRQNQPEEC